MSTLNDIVKEKIIFFASFEDKFKKGVNALFAELPTLEAITWQQWTPSFNDGEPCEPCVGKVHFIFDEDKQSDEDEDDDYGDEPKGTPASYLKDKEKLNNTDQKLLIDFSKEFDQLEVVINKIFGTDKEITIKKDGTITIEDYDCGY